MNEQTRRALELARESLFAPMNTTKFHQAIAAIDAALSAPAAPVAPDRDAFEDWARQHGGFDLLRNGPLGLTDGGWHFATYRSHATEAAWRAWANRPAPAAPVTQPVSEPSDEQIIDACASVGLGPTLGLQVARAVLALRPKVQPLTDEQINALEIKGFPEAGDGSRKAYVLATRRLIARAVERAHGIGQGDA